MDKWLVAKRKDRDLSQAKLADLVGVDRAYITKIEQGKQRPGVEVAKRLGELLGFRWTHFFEHRDFIPHIVYVAFENLTAEHPVTFLEEGLLFRPDLVISRLEKRLATGHVTFWVRRVEQFEGSNYYKSASKSYPDLLFHDSEDLLKDMATLSFVEFLNKYLAEDKFEE